MTTIKLPDHGVPVSGSLARSAPAVVRDQPRQWVLYVPAPVPLVSVNRRGARQEDAARRHAIRESTYGKALDAHLPFGLVRPRVDVLVEFTTNRNRDTSNLHPTVGKPALDALGPGRAYRSKVYGRLVDVVEHGYGVVADDSPGFLHCTDCPHLTVGVLARELIPRFPYGRIVVTITDSGGAPC